MSLGSITFTAVTWTTGDLITETKMDNMQANTQAYDAHAAQGILLNNNTGFYQKDSGGTNREILNLNASNVIDLGHQLYYTNHKGYNSGWNSISETWTYSSWTATGRTAVVTVSSGAASRFSKGMKVKFSQTTDGVKYGFIVKVTDTTLTIFLKAGTDFDNETISSIYYSIDAAPLDFSLNEEDWSYDIITDTTNNVSGSITNEIWVNGGGSGLSGTGAIGLWRVKYYNITTCTRTSTATSWSFAAGKITLSTANNSESDAELSVPVGGSAVTGFSSASYAAIGRIDVATEALGLLDITTAATYYLNCWFSASGTLSNGGFRGDTRTTQVRLVCAYL